MMIYRQTVETAKQGKSEQVVIEGLENILRNVETLFDAEGVKRLKLHGTSCSEYSRCYIIQIAMTPCQKIP